MNLFIFSDTISDPSRLSIVSITWVEHFGNVCERKSSIHGWSLYWDFQSLRFRRYTYVLKNEKVILLCLKFTFSRSRQSNRSSEPCCHYRHWWKTRSWLRVTWWPTAFNNSWEPNLSLWQLGFGRYCSKFTFNYIFFWECRFTVYFLENQAYGVPTVGNPIQLPIVNYILVNDNQSISTTVIDPFAVGGIAHNQQMDERRDFVASRLKGEFVSNMRQCGKNFWF